MSFWDYKFQKAATTPNAGAPAAGNKHIGSEVDLDLEWKHSDNVSLMAGVGSFRPGGYINERNQPKDGPGTGQPTNPATMATFDVRVKF